MENLKERSMLTYRMAMPEHDMVDGNGRICSANWQLSWE